MAGEAFWIGGLRALPRTMANLRAHRLVPRIARAERTVISSSAVCAGTRHHGLTLQAQWWQFALLAGRSPDADHGLGFAAVGLSPMLYYLAIHPVARIERAWKCDSCRGCHFVVCVYWRRRGIHATCRRFVRQHAIARLTPKVGASVRSLQVGFGPAQSQLPIAVALRTLPQALRVYLPGQ